MCGIVIVIGDGRVCAGRMGMRGQFVWAVRDGDECQWGRLGMETNFVGTDGDGGTCPYPCSSLVSIVCKASTAF